MSSEATSIIFIFFVSIIKCDIQIGPDPWNYDDESLKIKIEKQGFDIPPDLRIPINKKVDKITNNVATSNILDTGERFLVARTLGLVLKGGQYQKNDDESVDVSLKMHFKKNVWEALEEFITLKTPLTEIGIRRANGYIEEAICKPTLADQIVLVWSDYIQIYITEYKWHITWSLASAAIIGILIWFWRHISTKKVLIVVFIGLYLYEVFISYKEAEQKELQKFLDGMDKCKWYFWTSSCNLPTPDPLIFLKHMNPTRIAMRMFSTIISEPIIVCSDTIKTLVDDITGGLWYPFNRIVYGILMVSYNTFLVVLFIMILYNYILNIPFNLSLFGFLSLGVRQRNRAVPNIINNNVPDNIDRVSGHNLNRLLDVFTHAINNSNERKRTDFNQIANETNRRVGLRRSASTGRLSNSSSNSYTQDLNKIIWPPKIRNKNGSGDAH